MRALWSDRQSCSPNVSQNVKRMRRRVAPIHLKRCFTGRPSRGGNSLKVKKATFWGFERSAPVGVLLEGGCFRKGVARFHSGKDPQHVLTVLISWSWVLLVPRLRPSSWSGRLFRWASVMLHTPWTFAWICCPQLPSRTGRTAQVFTAQGGTRRLFGCNFFAYSRKLPAYSGALLLTVDNFSLNHNWSSFAYNFCFFAYSWSFLAYSGKVHLIAP